MKNKVISSLFVALAMIAVLLPFLLDRQEPGVYKPDEKLIIITPTITKEQFGTQGKRYKRKSFVSKDGLSYIKFPTVQQRTSPRSLNLLAIPGENYTATYSIKPFSKEDNSVSLQGGRGALFFAGAGRKNGQSQIAPETPASYGFIAMQSKEPKLFAPISETSYYITIQAVDPGGDLLEPLGNPLPVSDGLYFMLLLALGYALYRQERRQKQNIAE